MANKYMDTALLDKAIIFAVKAHANTERRGKGFPYIVHPMEAVEIVATITADQELLAAAALHDVVEDTDCTVDDVRREFGDRIADLVDAESDKFEAGVSETDSWRTRKQAAIDRLTEATLDAKIVAMGDKLSNMRAIARDYEQIGDALWNRFHAPGGKKDHEWHYRGLAGALWMLKGTNAYREFCYLIDKTFGEQKQWAPALINLDDYVESGDGYTAISYNHWDGHTMIKLYKEFMPKDMPIHELLIANAVVEMGLKTPLPGRYITDGKRFGSEFQRITDKKSYARAISNEPQKLEYYATLFAKMARDLHSRTCDTKIFPAIDKTYIDIVGKSKDFSDEEKERIINFIKSVPKKHTCIHGDMHIGNVITNDRENWWIALSDFSYGNPLFDLGLLYLAAKCNPEEMTQNLYHISNAQFAKVWKIFAREYAGADTPEKLAEFEAEVKPFAALKMIYFGNQDKLYPPMRKFIEEQLLS